MAEQDASGGELVAALEDDGRPSSSRITRAEAHRTGKWHRATSIFVLNQYGEVLVERRSENKDLFPGFYDIVGGHLLPGQKSLSAAVREIREELGVRVPAHRLKALAPEDSVIEQVALPERAIFNNERKSVYLLQLNPQEEAKVLRLAANLRQLTPDELEARGTSGEVSQIEFWPWERLLAMSNAANRKIASGTLSAIRNDLVREGVLRSCNDLRNARRKEFAAKYAFLSDSETTDEEYDQKLVDRFLERPESPAPVEEVNAIFEKGPRELAGAYEMGPFRRSVEGDERWEPKLRDPETRYVKNLLTAIGVGQNGRTQQKLDQVSPDIQSFVRALLNFPLSNGNRFRDNLGNLADIAAGRKAVLVWLKHKAPELAGAETLEYPTGAIARACLQASREMLDRFFRSNYPSGLATFRELVLLGLGASSTDFNNPAFQLHMKVRTTSQVVRFLQQNGVTALHAELGGDHFLSDFYENFVASGKQVKIAYLPGNVAQAFIGLAVCQEILRINGNAEIRFIPKDGAPGNDLTFEGAQKALDRGTEGVFSDLSVFSQAGRFTVEPAGPRCHGLDPGRLSANVARLLSGADVIVAEGQAYAEVRGWKKPTYIAFRVNGRVAEVIHGVPRTSAGFVRLTPGVHHFRGFTSAIYRSIGDSPDQSKIPAAIQTTAGYVRAILSENLELIGNHLFHGNHLEACRQLCAEGDRLGQTFAQVVLGAASEHPTRGDTAKTLRATRFRVFACGGGGGFNGVTLRALRQLGLPTVAGVPSTDDGGSTGELQRWLRKERGFVFGVGDMAAILQDALPDRGKRALLAYRFDSEPESLTLAVIRRIKAENDAPTYPDNRIGAAEDFLSFVCDQLNLARVIEQSFRTNPHNKLPIKGASIRNLNVVAAYELCGLLGERVMVTDDSRLAAFHVLQRALGLPADFLVLPVTYSESLLYIDYENPVPRQLAEDLGVPDEALANDRRRLYGQQYIDKLPQSGPRLGVGVVRTRHDSGKPLGNPEYLARLREAQLFVMGAGSLVGSQLSQLAIPGVVDILLERAAMRRILVLNHVKMDETLDMSVRDQVNLVEIVATQSASPYFLKKYAGAAGRLRISDIFTDIVVPRTIAREIEAEIVKRDYKLTTSQDETLEPVEIRDPRTNQTAKVFCNKYVKFLLDNPDVREQYDVTIREMEVLSFLDQPRSLYNNRSEKGRYRGPLFATADDIDYLVSRGIQLRSIHEVDSIGRNWKFVKSEGIPSIEEFPGLVPEALGGIFRIALERSSLS